MTLSAIAAIAYGLLALIGGIWGYTKAGSQTSLVSGVISGVLLLIGGGAQAQGYTWGWPLSVVITVLLVIVFTIRFIKTRKVMPAGVMIGAGVLAFIAMLLQLS